MAAVVSVWQWAPLVPGITRWAPILDPFFISSPARIVAKFWELTTTTGDTGAILKSGNLFVQLGATLEATVLGFVVGVRQRVPGRAWCCRSARTAARHRPSLPGGRERAAAHRAGAAPHHDLRHRPRLAKVVLAWLIVFFIVFFNTYAGAARSSRHPRLLSHSRRLAAAAAVDGRDPQRGRLDLRHPAAGDVGLDHRRGRRRVRRRRPGPRLHHHRRPRPARGQRALRRAHHALHRRRRPASASPRASNAGCSTGGPSTSGARSPSDTRGVR